MKERQGKLQGLFASMGLYAKKVRIGVVIVSLGLFGFVANTNAASISYDYNFSGASGGVIANITNVQEVQFLASSILGFNDGDGSGGISTGDTFTDYTMIRATVMTDSAGNVVSPTTYGSQPGATHEITVKTVFNGLQISDNQYIVTSIDLFEFYFDYEDGSGGFTGSNFSDLTTFQDTPLGSVVEDGVLGGPSGGNNAGPTAPDGTIDLVILLSDVLNTFDPQGDFFELDTDGNPLDTTGSVLLTGLVDSNNVVTPPGQTLGGLNGGTVIGGNAIAAGGGFADVFAAFGLAGLQNANGTFGPLSISDTANGTFDFAFQTRSDGSFVKDVAPIPEPSTMSLMALGIIFLTAYGWSRRRHGVCK